MVIEGDKEVELFKIYIIDCHFFVYLISDFFVSNGNLVSGLFVLENTWDFNCNNYFIFDNNVVINYLNNVLGTFVE